MAASYPGVLPSFTTKADNVDINWAADINRLQDEVVALATELGVEPSAGFSDVGERLDHLQTTKSDVGHRHDERYVQRAGFNAKGDLLAGTSDHNSSTLSAGSSGQMLISDPLQTVGMRWKTPHHGDLTGKSNDDHPQYLTDNRHAEIDHNIPPDRGPYPTAVDFWHNNLRGLEYGNGHPQYARRAKAETITGHWNFEGTWPTIAGFPLVLGRDGTERIFVRSSAPSGVAHGPGDIWIRP